MINHGFRPIKIISAVAMLLIIIIFVAILTGCATVVSTEYKTVQVEIVDAYHKTAWTQPIWNGKRYTYIFHPAKHIVVAEYNGVEFSVDDSKTYSEYKNKVGEVVEAKLEIRMYDNGNIKTNIVKIGGE